MLKYLPVVWLAHLHQTYNIGYCMANLIFIIICLLWGSSFILMKKAMIVFNAPQISIGRLIGGFIALVIIWILFNRKKSFNRKDLIKIAIFSPFAHAIPFTLQPYLMTKFTGQPSAFIGIMVCLVPLLTILVSIPMLKIMPSKQQLIGVCGGLLCMSWLFYDKLTDGASIQIILLAAITPLCYAWSNTYVKMKLTHISSMEMSAISSFMSIILILVFSFFAWPITEIDFDHTDFDLALISLLILGFICAGTANFMYYKMIHMKGPLFAGMVTYVIPIIAILWGIYDGEQVKVTQIIPILGCLVMIMLVQSSKPTKPAQPLQQS